MLARTTSSRLGAACTAASAAIQKRSHRPQLRGFFTALISRTAASEAASPTPQPPKSIAAHGTVLKGLNIYKEGKDPVALKDEDYPEWLWTLLDEVPEAAKSEREQQRLQRSRAIKEANFMKSKKK
ncbi:hypothetical protein GGI04_001779 [Coemansia thaxteri]|uniref:Large ribosomal subunit protein mL54 n=1 Tax=Coemansia thaxteri TaxID=2663907 RepID=A0A9W8BK88_9FUNG|nr:hypothetical protein H4R26_002219 [Coemansia thaxteri]KAJ2006729.1 hypothetical protein GGI04_001779 [Coemansia thaxteri]KAJ2471323.1 hypothetical protein GGI02_002341 [Coemansia sp. RSA 2322]KAJ2487197.1 hypothetical protein EV174_000678 [Coemansia sp. RSA 2320]